MHAVAHDRAVVVALVPHDWERHIVHGAVGRAKDEGADAVLARHRVRVAKLLDQPVVLLLQTHNVDEELEGRCAEARQAHSCLSPGKRKQGVRRACFCIILS